MKFNLLEQQEILDFEKRIGFELEVNERANSMYGGRYYVHFPKGEIMEGGCLIGATGNGTTIDEALIAYCKEISGKRLAFNSYTCERREIEMPKLVHTKLLYK